MTAVVIPLADESARQSLAALATPVFTDWFEIGPVAIAFLTVLAAAVYYWLVLRQNRTTHQFDVLMRSVAVYHEFMPVKRSIAGAFLLERLRNARRTSTVIECLAIADIMRYFDTISWRAFSIFKFDLGSCDINRICSHRWHRGLQQRHEGVRAIVREIGLPAYIYYYALREAGQDTGQIVREAALDSLTQFTRMVDAVSAYMPRVTGVDLERDLPRAKTGHGYYVDFLRRETRAPAVRPDALSAPAHSGWLLGLRKRWPH